MAQSAAKKVALYAAVGPDLTHYDVDVDGATLTKRATTTLPANIHYCWPHASQPILYVASSDAASGMGGNLGQLHNVTALKIDPATGALSPHGAAIELPRRPIHMTTDIPSENILVAFSNPSGLHVYKVNPDGTPGAEVGQQAFDPGIYGHQVRVTLDNRKVILVARGHDAAGGKPEEPGSLKVFDYAGGKLTNEASVEPNGGYGFGPRHLDFHPSKPWVYVSLERQNRLDTYKFDDKGALSADAVYRAGTLSEPDNIRGRQAVGTVKLHPNGRYAYVANRASSSREENGKRVFVGGENTLSVFAIDQTTGEPKPIQHIDTRGIHCRNFHLDPSGRLFVASHIMGLPVRGADGAVSEVPACLSVFRVGGDGKLEYVRKYDVDVGNRQMFWMGMVAL